ncbi:MAG: pseudouridine-5'-phosphate glycosidase [Synergistes sp.]|nr:pseudouridine-5'-phosphate glycosidase [Synergistes sp.]
MGSDLKTAAQKADDLSGRSSRAAGFLTESCLLAFSLPSIDDEELAREWERAGAADAQICWVENGKIIAGTMERFIRFRASAPRYKFSSDSFERALKEGMSGALTASAAMEACRRLSVPCAVSCGIGGIYGTSDGEKCCDLTMIRDSGVVLVCTSPKDMLDAEKSVAWLRRNGVAVLGCGSDLCTGFVFSGSPVQLSGAWQGGAVEAPAVILRGIADEMRIKDEEILKKAVCEAKEAELRGGYFHPAANSALDRLTDGYSSRLQLYSLLDNIRFAAELFFK